ncbi:uncharacterized protein OCT59_002971 [Rhizophagus irregularis]|uniref:Uncharacterized protein n=1 Tax=Rhizophagus irregularis (strain DAOM 181602 / DAOM 197198 / MUCL 43194) TaxID=747089 RepID=U9V747_RHIID|nr:hypothetical protein GLOIN_2v1779523 [Rhizophagus irregularis DAOM 181602=DAOM 197198]POG67297.1 hypothetical protein GLOIN_2v1779523 [Rhizophagus irregularis DAOM 181602=DAOM 197198]UZO11402.1 hypothetical protein OCT59_002971 [Rhizophagus irregularis]GET63569.1 hypothetical protein GLOIN_2v1779523 [Rhizophagus irregularis DAOM 181602=DAOM 197198]CAB4481407.1 unnamed protein product [Rhizophagus irregularis]|eukprot:XP_025174163.1 hypothetical protein GLOIN_2v1779523 [Rhizophagus irregularis DAOM 181602=DAOM 197198]
MSSKNYGQKTCETPQIPKFCSDCEEMSDSVKLFSSKNTIYQKFSLENLHKLVTFTTQYWNNNNEYSSSIKNIDNESNDKCSLTIFTIYNGKSD